MVGYQGVSLRPASQRQSATARQRREHRPRQRAGQMRDRGIAADDEIKVHHHRGGVEEEIGVGVRIGIRHDDFISECDMADLRGGRALL